MGRIMDKNKLIPDIIRYVLTVALLVFVFLNSHWAVALSITLITIRCEIVDRSILKIVKRR